MDWQTKFAIIKEEYKSRLLIEYLDLIEVFIYKLVVIGFKISIITKENDMYGKYKFNASKEGQSLHWHFPYMPKLYQMQDNGAYQLNFYARGDARIINNAKDSQKSEIGAYLKGIEECIRDYKLPSEITPYPVKVITKVDKLPSPFQFTDVLIRSDPQGDYISYKKVFMISNITNISVVVIRDDGYICETGIDNPNKNVWFHIECCAPGGATFDIITDLKGFYPVRRYGGKRITTETNPKTSVDLNDLSTTDLEFIKQIVKIRFGSGG